MIMNSRKAQVAILAVMVGLSLYTVLAITDVVPPVDAKTPPKEVAASGSRAVALAGAMFAFIFGPLMLLYGYKIQETIIVLNALIASGVSSFMLSLQYVQTANADVSGGKLMPSQLLTLFKILLSTYTLAAMAMKVRSFNVMVKGAVIATLLVTLLLDQMPPQLGCACELNQEGYPCTPVLNPALYQIEPSCFSDKWLRLVVRAAAVALASVFSRYAADVVIKLNTVMVAANLCNEAIFDTILAIAPHHGSRVQPYRMIAFAFFAVFGYTAQFAQEKWDEGGEAAAGVAVIGQPLFRFFWGIGKVVMAPLLLVNAICAMIGGGGKGAGAGGAGSAAGAKPKGGLCFLYGMMFNPAVARVAMLIVNTAMMCVAMLVMSFGTELADYASAGFFEPAYITVLMLAAAVVLFTALLGCGGAFSRKKAFLVPYALLVGTMLVLEVGMVSAMWDKYKAAAPEEARDVLKEHVVGVWGQGNCTTVGAPPFGAARPYSVACTSQRWVESFVNTQCTYKGAADVAALRNETVGAVLRDDFHQLRYYGSQLALVAQTEARIAACLADYNTTITAQAGEGAFCVCSNVLMSKVALLKNIGIAALCLVVLQVVVLLMTFVLMGMDPVILAATAATVAVTKVPGRSTSRVQV